MRRAFIVRELGQIKISIGWFHGMEIVFFQLSLLDYEEPTLWILSLQILKFVIEVGVTVGRTDVGL